MMVCVCIYIYPSECRTCVFGLPWLTDQYPWILAFNLLLCNLGTVVTCNVICPWSFQDSVIKILDTLYHDRDYARFFVLETIARVPYFGEHSRIFSLDYVFIIYGTCCLLNSL